MRGNSEWSVAGLSAVMLLLAVMLAGCTLLPAEEEALAPPLVKPPQENYRTVAVERGTITQEIRGNGVLESYASDAAQFRAAGGRVDKVFVKAGDMVKKGDPLIVLDVENMDIELKQLELNMERSRAALRTAKLSDDDEVLRLAKLQYELDWMKYDRLREAYENRLLSAGMDGQVTFVADVAEGDKVNVYETLVMVSDPLKLRVAFPAEDTPEAHNISVGQPAQVSFSTDSVVEGKITQTPSSAPATDDEMLRSRYASHIYVEVDKLPEGAAIGMRANIHVVLQERKDVLLIPRSGLRSYLGRTFVRILDEDNKIREMDVEKGIIGSTEVEIVKGLEEGELVVLQ
ncbi:biotin/lipoyl-binding protein [Paenibacillus sp. J5C_2022]|uniref:efflux RND transporter periplasmic adaptor subunit n=1 Tax=Paenibacillus sp. J5C2022 TaxID=2977129 RepID=UPI0021D2F582|nr:biotin/lipoyl-binding protein [Paenibacillus sp. J5C2022]MCU6712931.1 biotin/lipoyl-binding protein [Paenibacillus sp. J5C2022]